MFNIISYILYLAITFYITLFVGWKVYKIGFVYLENLIQNHQICKAINKILLIGYYLVNLGFSAICLKNWNIITNLEMMIQFLAYKIGIILLILGILHFINLSIIYIASKKQSIKL